MTQSKMLSYLLGTTSKVEILRVLFESDDAMTGRRIASTAKISPRSCQLSLDSLVKVNALHRKAVGRAYSYTLNREHKVVWDLLRPIFEAEREITKQVGQLVARLLRPASKDISAIFFDLQLVKKAETFHLVIVTTNKKGALEADQVAKLEEAIVMQFGFLAKIEAVAASDFSGKYFASEAAKKRFADSYEKLKGASFEELVGMKPAKRGRKKSA